MANPEHVAVVKQGAEATFRWRNQHPGERLDLHEANLSGTDLHGADLVAADLSRANLSGADLHGAYLGSSNL
jgi:uncharacterized protein YjbI with pentapeptide repeats